jgi:alpha-1,2-glucosyltransferase
MLVRQNNVIWTAFIPVIYYYQNYGLKFGVSHFTEIARKTWVFIIGFILFIAFVILNKGVAIGDASKHPAFMFSAGNIVFILFCFFLFFLPLQIANIPKVVNFIKSNFWTIPLSLALAALYWFTFKVDHPYNQIETHYFLRNLVLTRFTASTPMKIIFFLPVIYAFWSLVVTELKEKSYYFIYLFTIIFLAPSWLIEQRYYMIPFMLFMVFRKDQILWVEVSTIVYYMFILIWLMPLVVAVKAFL